MYYRIFDEDEGEFLNSAGERKNLLSCIKFDAPAGSELATGWEEFNNDFDALEYFGLFPIPTPEEIEILL